MRCPHCGQEHPDMTVFCPVTGNKLTADFCTNCRAEIQPSWKICPKCGTPVHLPIATKISSRQAVGPSTAQKRIPVLISALFAVVVLAFIAFFIFSNPGRLTGSTSSKVSQEINAVEGGKLVLSNNTSVTIPSGSLQNTTQASMEEISKEGAPALPKELVSVGSAYLVNLGSEPLQQPVTLQIPFDPALLATEVNSDQVFLSYYDEDKKAWVFAGGKVDTVRNVVILETSHASWWMPTTWNWQAWIAVLTNLLEVNISGLIDAVALLTDDCAQTGSYVQVDSSQAHNLVQGCIEEDDAQQLELRIVNPKSFYFEIGSISGGNQYPRTELLSPGEDLTFNAFTSDPAPLIIEARMTQKAGWYLVIHMILTMLPGANQFGIQPDHVACITERMDDVSDIAQAVESLFVDQDGVASADRLHEFFTNTDAMGRLINAADDCNFGPAPTWSIEGLKQIGGAVSTILSFTDYTANYFAGNSPARLSFTWASPTPQSKAWIAFLKDNNIWLIHSDGTGLMQVTKNGSQNTRINEFKWSPNGQALAYSMTSSSGSAILLYDIQTSISKMLIGDDVRGGFDWSLTGNQIIYDTPSKPSDPWTDKGLWVLNLTSDKRRQVVSPSSTYSGFMNPQWSSDSSHVLFTIPAFEPAGYGVADFTAGTTVGLPLNVLGGAGMGNCEWAPSDLRIVCTTLTDETPRKPELRFLGVNGNVLEKILLPEKMSNAIVKWSPDGQKLAIGYYNEGKAWTDILSLKTGDSQTLSSGFPSDWSPDSEWILTWESGLNVLPAISLVNVGSGQSFSLSEGILAVWQP